MRLATVVAVLLLLTVGCKESACRFASLPRPSRATRQSKRQAKSCAIFRASTWCGLVPQAVGSSSLSMAELYSDQLFHTLPQSAGALRSLRCPRRNSRSCCRMGFRWRGGICVLALVFPSSLSSPLPLPRLPPTAQLCGASNFGECLCAAFSALASRRSVGLFRDSVITFF